MLGDNRPVLSKSWELLRTEVFMDSLEMPAESTLEPGWGACPTQDASPAQLGEDFYRSQLAFLWRSRAFCGRPAPATGPATAGLGSAEQESVAEQQIRFILSEEIITPCW